MPARIRLKLAGPPAAGPHRHAEGIRALVMASIRRADPELAAAVHDANRPNPIAIGPLETTADRADESAFEIAILKDSMIEPLLEGLPRVGAAVNLGPARYVVADGCIVAAASFRDLSSLPPHDRSLRLNVLTPTAHHAPGAVRRTIVVPDPRLYAGSWLGRWNLFADARFDPALLNAVAQCVVVSAFSGGTRAIKLDGRRVFIGFVGSVTFHVLDASSGADDVAAALWTLARFAEYSGTGVETMRGMGCTRIAQDRRGVHPLR